MRSLGIAHILSSFGIGGQERVALDLARSQLALGHRVCVFSIAPPPDGPLAADFLAAGIATETVPKGKRVDPTLPFRLARRLRGHAIDIVHTHNPLALIYGATAGRLARAAVVHTKHGANLERARKVFLRRIVGSLTDAFVAVSPMTAEMARKTRDVADRKLFVIRNGIDLARFSPDERARAEVRGELGIPEAAWVVGTVGRLVALKNQALLIRALAGTDQQIVIVGDGPERDALERAAAEVGMTSAVHLVGARRDVPRLLAAFDVFTLPSNTEGLPLVLPEAMAAGLPVVATAVGGVPDVVVEDEVGHLVPPGDAEALRQRLVGLAADRPRARWFGARARELALQRYSLARMSEAYMEIYQRLV